jgi:hypothetical protein
MRYLVRDAAGHELLVPTLRDLHRLYVGGFLADDDLVRPETGTNWTRAGAMPALLAGRERRAGPRRLLALLAAAIVLVLAVALLVG